MGANAQTTVPTFTAGQVLTADQQNQSARTGIPVFATTVTRDAGFGGTGEKTLAEGQMCYVEGTGLQSYDGSSWVTWGTTGQIGMTFITSGTITAAASTSVNNCFTSTYRNYRLVVQATLSTGSTDAGLRLRASGTDSTGSNYLLQNLVGTGVSVTAASATTTSFLWLPVSTTAGFGTIDISGPNVAANTFVASYGGNPSVFFGTAGRHDLTTQYDGFTLFVGSGTLTGTYRLYGLKD